MITNAPVESKCKKGTYHDFYITQQDMNALVDVCKKCGMKVIYNKKNGEMDDRKYARYNYRKFLQPIKNTQMGADYEREYKKKIQ